MSTQTHRLNLSAGLASVLVAAVLVGLKLWALWITGALSIAASLTDSAMDLMVSLGAVLAILYAARPADDDHAFGHSSAEDLAALAQAALVLVSAGVILWTAAGRLLGTAEPLTAQGAGITVMVVSVVLTGALVAWQTRVARRTGNRVVAADRLHYLGDLIPTAGAILALWLSDRFGLTRVDAVIAALAALWMGRGALGIGRAAWDALMDRTADPKIVAGVAEMARAIPEIRGFHDLRTRTAGSRLFVHIHIELDGDQPLRQAHATAARLKAQILERHPGAYVIVHQDVAKTDPAQP
ncbi:cation diffusion facilitator family transporter [Phaeovulum vinaykumarii]|uniref:Ferrous-iron efflux pump FieF n=1 Tax=Phaeovulum vinaykumarii TaxID=407234 RepID=A0A1N7L1E2_9RHOB|nr:cation diffusion facilitator family transporter [Phaeovulum vinaykumarii]SIS67556.1 ferrous-iron efflux pump FieF [Phaeovulum vinaykumarii]SOC00678.1 ferrous-iron efflux pump FieF [Phaeovulum vinaykumarii]